MVKSWAECIRLETENAQLEHVINYWKIEAETDNARWLRVLEENERLKAEVERLTSDIQMEKENEDRLVRLHQDARNEVERLTKAGDAMATGLQGMAGERAKALADEWNAAKEGGQP